MLFFKKPVADKRDVGGPLQPMLTVEGLRRHFVLDGGVGEKRAVVHAVDDISFEVAKNKTLGVVGESGCGKSTTARLLMRLIEPDTGAVIVDGEEVGKINGLSVKDLRHSVQMVFQDSYASLNPRMTLEETIMFGPRANGVAKEKARQAAHDILRRVGLSPENFAQRMPHELSGGQRQRVNIARALAMNPRLLILDEAVSALDKSVEAQVLNLLQDLKQELGLTYVFISHDLNVVRYISDRVMVMYLGKVVEIGDVVDIYERPKHPYTKGLLSSRPSMDPQRRRTSAPLTGDPPSPINPPSGCRFRTRCNIAEAICAEREPPLTAHGSHAAACHATTPGSGHSLAPLPN